MHAVLITIHAIAGLTALGAGGLALMRRRPIRVYLWSLAVCIVALAAAVAGEWDELEQGSRVAFAALVALGAFMIWRGLQARPLQPRDPTRPSRRYIDHLGFIIVALSKPSS